MIGNDIIDRKIAATESNWRRAGFLDKIFDASEIALIEECADPELLIWLIWSMKEAVYKIINRRSQIRKYDPWRYIVSDIKIGGNTAGAIVTHNEEQFVTNSHFSADLIDTVAVRNQRQLEFIIDLNGCSDVQYVNKIPLEKLTGKPASRSHHGRFERTVCLSDPEFAF